MLTREAGHVAQQVRSSCQQGLFT